MWLSWRRQREILWSFKMYLMSLNSSNCNHGFSVQTHIHPSQFYRTLSTELKDVVWVCNDEDRTSTPWSSCRRFRA
jgi:hypothetical protein